MQPPVTYFEIVPGEGGRWTVVNHDRNPVFPGSDFRSPNEALNAILDIAKAGAEGADVVYTREGVPQMVVLGGMRRPDSVKPGVVLRLSITAELDALVDNMADDLGLSKGDTILKAIGLLKIALDARQEGKRIGILDENLDVDQEITI
jgi:hypothetical protein